MATHYIEGRAKGRVPTGPSMPQNDSSGYLVKGRGVARPCPDRPSMPAADTSGHLITGRGWWRAPCVEATEECLCGGIFDDGNRVEASDWGTSTDGHLWSYAHINATELSVDGANLRAFFPGSSFVSSAEVQADSPGQWDTDFALRTRFQLTNADQILQLAFYVYDEDIDNFAGFFMGPRTGSILTESVGSGDSASFTFSDGWYLARWEYNFGGVARAKVWAEGDAEPDWQLSSVGNDNFAPTRFMVFPRGRFNAEDSAIDIDYIDFNKCMYDNFSHDNETDWGSSNPTSIPYEYPEGMPGGVTLSSSTFAGVGFVNIPDGVSTVHIRMPSYPMWQGDEGFVGSYDFQVGTQSSLVPGTDQSVRIDLFHGDGSLSPMDIFIDFSSDPDVGTFLIYDGTILDSMVKDDWIVDEWYRVKFERRPDTTVFRAKVWLLADIEPGWMLTAAATSGLPLHSYLEFALDNLSDSDDVTITFDNITFDKCPTIDDIAEG